MDGVKMDGTRMERGENQRHHQTIAEHEYEMGSDLHTHANTRGTKGRCDVERNEA